jgi:hypothetical protein
MKLGFKAFSKPEEDFFLMKTVCRLSFYDVQQERDVDRRSLAGASKRADVLHCSPMFLVER